MKKHRITLTEGEIYILAHLTRHFTDYMCGDDRPDHGMGMLKTYREDRQGKSYDDLPQYLKDFLSAMGKLNRKDRKIRFCIKNNA